MYLCHFKPVSRVLVDSGVLLETRGAQGFLLKEETDLSIEEIGRVTGVSRETAKSRLRYALNKLRSDLGRSLPDAGPVGHAGGEADGFAGDMS